MLTSTRNPPRKKIGQGLGHRTLNGLALDVRSGAELIGVSQKTLRGMVARQCVPYRRLNARIVFLKSELERWLERLPGCDLDEARMNMEARMEPRHDER